MSANISQYIGRQSAWHGLGTVTGQYQSWADLCKHGLNWTAKKEQLLDARGNKVEAWGTFRYDAPDAPAIFLGAVGKSYTLMHHSTGFEMADALVYSKDGAHYETAGSLGNGEVVWGLADLNLSLSVGADKSNIYLVFFTSYDGSYAYTFRTTSVRIVCQNTLRLALSKKAEGLFRIRHTAGANEKLRDARRALAELTASVSTMEEKLNFLATRKVRREDLTGILDRLFPKTEKEDGKEESSVRRNNILLDILHRYDSNDNNAFPEQRGTAYNLLNAVTEYTDHYRTAKDARARSESAVLGQGARLKDQALDIIMETAEGMPVVARPTIYTPTAPAYEATPADRRNASLLDSILDGTSAPISRN